jgi:predicted PurR-regulated permease PerM
MVAYLDDASGPLKPWITFAGGALVIVVLYWAQAVLVPIALAILLTFVLAPPVTRVMFGSGIKLTG